MSIHIMNWRSISSVEVLAMNREDPFSGKWELNPGKSQFEANQRSSGATMRWERTLEGYKMTAKGTVGDGTIVREGTIFILDGKDHPVPGAPGCTAIMSRSTTSSIDVESKNADGSVGRARYVVSEDETTLTASVSGIDAQRRPFQ